MLNNRTLFPALFNPTGGGGGGSGQTIQVTELPEAVLSEKDKIYQYIGSTTETLTNGFFYKCVEKTETEGSVITVTYEWKNIPVMEVESSGGINYSSTPHIVGKYNNQNLWEVTIFNPQLNEYYRLVDNPAVENIVNMFGTFVNFAYEVCDLFGANNNVISNVWYSQGNGVQIMTASGASAPRRVNHITIQYIH